MLKIVNIAGLRLLSLERPLCKVGVWLESKNLNGKQSPQTENKCSLINKSSSSLCLNICTSNMVYAEDVLSFWDLEFWYMLRRGGLHGQLQVKTELLGSVKLPWQITFHICCHNLLQEQLNLSCVTLPGENFWKFQHGFFQNLLLSVFLFCFVFPFADFALYLFSVINHSCKYNNILPVSCESF